MDILITKDGEVKEAQRIAFSIQGTKEMFLSEEMLAKMSAELRKQNPEKPSTVTPESPLDVTLDDCGCTFHLDHLKDIEEGKDIVCPHGENRWLVKWEK